MDNINIQGVILTPLKKIYNPKGDVFHCIKKKDNGFAGFGEAYFSTVIFGNVKDWKKHTKTTLNLIVPVGKIKFVLYDDRENSISKNHFFEVELSKDNYKRLTVPPNIWMSFKGTGHDLNLLLNITDIEHNPKEFLRLKPNEINYNW